MINAAFRWMAMLCVRFRSVPFGAAIGHRPLLAFRAWKICSLLPSCTTFTLSALSFCCIQILLNRGLLFFAKNEFVAAQESFQRAATVSAAAAVKEAPPDERDGETCGTDVAYAWLPAIRRGGQLAGAPPS